MENLILSLADRVLQGGAITVKKLNSLLMLAMMIRCCF